MTSTLLEEATAFAEKWKQDNPPISGGLPFTGSLWTNVGRQFSARGRYLFRLRRRLEAEVARGRFLLWLLEVEARERDQEIHFRWWWKEAMQEVDEESLEDFRLDHPEASVEQLREHLEDWSVQYRRTHVHAQEER